LSGKEIAVPTLVRKNAWKLSTISKWEPTLLWYAKAVGEMSTRPATDPTSWRFQAGVHGYSKRSDPFVGAGPIPKKAVTDKFWGQCQHGSWFFLPWHRMYLGLFEQIVRAAVVKLGGPADWTLPYWNYSDATNPNAKTLPPAFREPKLPDGSPNPLFVIRGVTILRAPAITGGNPAAIPDRDVDITGCLEKTFFSPTTDITVGDLGFGGPDTAANHDGHFFGVRSIESVPHNAIHMDVGGDQTLGWMTDPDTAALDPIFWMHHANIDRLWAVWNRMSASHSDPTVPVNVGGRKITWATSIKFNFYDATGKPVSMTPSQVTDTKVPFNYDYDDTSNPLPKAKPAKAVLAAAMTKSMAPQRPEMVGASGKKLTLTGSPQSAAISIQPPTGPAKAKTAKAGKAQGLRVTAQPAPEGKTYLHIENVVSKKAHTTYEVYVNLPENPDAGAYEEHYAGSMHLFGVVRASTRSARSAGNGLSFSMDITGLVESLKQKNAWDEKRVRVAFLPRAGVEGKAAKHDPITVGRISIYQA
jgi:tyrosinase